MTSEEIYNQLLEDFKVHIKPLSEISSGDNGKNFFLSDEKYLCFDDVKFREHDGAGKAPDLLAFYKNGIVFVEFKEGKVENVKKEDVKLKVIEGINSIFKYCNKKSSMTKVDFSSLDFDYFVIHRRSKSERRSVGDAMKASMARWSLDEYKGYYLRAADTISSHDKAFKLLNLLSNGSLVSGIYVNSDNTQVEWTLPN